MKIREVMLYIQGIPLGLVTGVGIGLLAGAGIERACPINRHSTATVLQERGAPAITKSPTVLKYSGDISGYFPVSVPRTLKVDGVDRKGGVYVESREDSNLYVALEKYLESVADEGQRKSIEVRITQVLEGNK